MEKNPDQFQRPNIYEERGRQRKALTLVNHLHAQGLTAVDLEVMDPNAIAGHAFNAGVVNPSPETWDLVKEMSRRETSRQRPMDDPFAGLA